MADVRRNDDVGRYEIWLDGGMVGLTQFRVRPDGVLVFPHTEVSEDHRGQGLAGQLIGGALDDVGAGRDDHRPVPCRSRLHRDHPEYADLQAAA